MSLKWKRMVQEAEGKFFCLQASDDYPHPTRNQDAWDADVDWFDCNRYYQYDVVGHRLIRYDGRQKTDMPREKWKTGFNMVIRTERIKDLPDDNVAKSVDGWLLRNSNPRNRYVDPRELPGISTNGMNTISVKRIRFYNYPEPPFYPTTKKLSDIGLPKEIVTRLETLIRNTGGYDKRKPNYQKP